MPNLRTKTWTTTTPAYVEDAQFWEDHLISDTDAAKAASSVQSVNNITPDGSGNVDIVALPAGGTAGQVLTKLSSTAGDADWEDPASSGHTIQNASGTDMAQQDTLQFLNAEVTNDSVNGKTVVNCNGEKGDKGDKGDTGATPDITITATTDTIPSLTPSINVVKTGTTAAPVFDLQFSGFKGEKGDTGSAGAAGPAATVTVGTVTTLPSGSNATVTNVGSTSAAIFDFGIPKGADGSGSISDAFKTIKVGSTSVVAHEADTFNIVPGTNIEFSADTTTKTMTITATYPPVDVPGVVNNLTSTSTTDALSAYQGNLLNAAVLLKANSSSLGATAFSNDYGDLDNKPTIPAAQIQSDWAQTTTSALDYIKNKPTIPIVTNTYDASSNDAMSGVAVASGIASAVSGKANITDLDEYITGTQSGDGVVSNGSVTFHGIDDTPNYSAHTQGYVPFVWLTSTSVNLSPYAKLTAASGFGTNNLTLTYETDADNGATVYLRVEK